MRQLLGGRGDAHDGMHHGQCQLDGDLPVRHWNLCFVLRRGRVDGIVWKQFRRLGDVRQHGSRGGMRDRGRNQLRNAKSSVCSRLNMCELRRQLVSRVDRGQYDACVHELLLQPNGVRHGHCRGRLRSLPIS